MAQDTLTITDNRTGARVHAADRRRDDPGDRPRARSRSRDDDFGLMTYDPAFMNTAACRSAITYIDGDAGILRYRGLPDRAARRAGQLPRGGVPAARGRAADRRSSSTAGTDDVRYHTYVHTNITKFLEGFRYDAHPMGMLLGAVGALSTFYPDAKDIDDPENRYLQRVRLLAKMPTIAAFAFRHSRGLPYVLPAQRPRLHRQLRQHDVRDRRPARAEQGAAARARDPPRSSTPTTSRTARPARSAASARRTSTRSRRSRPGSRRSTGRCTAAPTRRCCGCSTRSATRRTSRRSSRR